MYLILLKKEISQFSPTSKSARDGDPSFLSSFTCQNHFLKGFDSESLTLELVDFFQKAPIALHWLSSTGLILWANGKLSLWKFLSLLRLNFN